MFHYPCLLSSLPFKNVEECRTLSKFVELDYLIAMGESDEYAKAGHPWIAATTDRLAQRRGKSPQRRRAAAFVGFRTLRARTRQSETGRGGRIPSGMRFA
jgi:hypothetical protein